MLRQCRRYALRVLALALGLALAVGVAGVSTSASKPAPRPNTQQTYSAANSATGGCRVIVPAPNPSQDNNFVQDVAVISPNDVWIVGYYDGDNFSVHSFTMHWDGSVWSHVPSPNPDLDFTTLSSVDAVSANDVWAVGEKGRNTKLHFAIHWDGQQWTELPVPIRAGGQCWNRLSGVQAIAANDVWAVGYTTCEAPGIGRNVTVHWNGSAWSQEF